jgi:hypothetical protein
MEEEVGTTPVMPDPPPGYRTSYPFHYPMQWLSLVSLGVFLVACPLLFWLTAAYRAAQQRTAILSLEVDTVFTLVAWVLLLPTVTILVIVVHELLHGLALRVLGYRVSYGIAPHLGAAYAAAFGQFLPRRHMLPVALTPLVGLTLLLVPLLTVPNRFVVGGALLALLINSSGAVGDIYAVWRTLRMPRGTLFYDIDPLHMLVFEPAERSPS